MKRAEAHTTTDLAPASAARTTGEPAKALPAGNLEFLWQDLRYAVRVLRKKPGFTITAVLTLALGMGANTAIFSVVNAALLTPIPIPDPERVVMLWTDNVALSSQGFPASAPDFVDWQASGVFEHLAGFTTNGFNLLIGTRPERIEGASVTRDWFDIQRLKPYLGRLFRAEDMQPGHDQVALLTLNFWHARFHADPSVVGRTLIINSSPYTIIGVLPKKIANLEDEQIYFPLIFEPPLSNERGIRYINTIGRLSPNLSFAAARNRIRDLSTRLSNQYPKEDGAYRTRLQPVEEAYVEDVHTLLWVLFGAVGFVLLVACANVAGLLLVRGTARQREIAIRTALGASKYRVVRQLLTESVLLSVLAAVTGIIPAFCGIRILSKFQLTELPNPDLVTLNATVLIFTLLVALATGVLFGLVPASQAWRTDASSPLRERSQISAAHRRFGNLFVTGQVALTVILVIGAGLMLRSFIRLCATDPGYASQHVLTMRIALTGKQYDAAGKQAAFFKQLINRITPLPGVDAAAAIDSLPTSNDVEGGHLHFTDRPEPRASDLPAVVIGSITPDYFRVMRIPLVTGRFFTDADGASDPLVVIVDRDLARQYWPDHDPTGRFVKLRLHSPARKIVGVVGAVELSVAAKMKGRVGQVYIPLAQSPDLDPSSGMSLAISTRLNPLSLSSAVRGEIASLAPDQPIFQIESLEDARARGRASARLATWLLGFFAVLALLLAAVGVYGVVSYSVGERTREIGVRMALGADQSDVLRMVLGRGVLLILLGIVLGVAGAIALTRLMGSLLHGVSASDPLTFLAVSLLLMAVGMLASYIPARRASRIDPIIALRYE